MGVDVWFMTFLCLLNSLLSLWIITKQSSKCKLLSIPRFLLLSLYHFYIAVYFIPLRDSFLLVDVYRCRLKLVA